ncbi:hypothetical protein Taro_036503 [Colocasia esculenta]|uniref:Receptor-like serine/threonine-protein kinase n=1 Tax=Colocasia esculenta TaxID=4460 RepID=A0A843W1R7_COLES|nr:hypothetical protein [Colocasia esculenta]
MGRCATFSCWSILFVTLFSLSHGAGDTLNQSQIIEDGQFLISTSGGFVLGFFSPANSGNRYLGIWLKSSNDTVLWVANRDKPLGHSAGVLCIDAGGNLVVTPGKANDTTIWSSGLPNQGSTAARLLDSGNLVLTSANDSSNLLWQSFDHPSDTLLAGMKLGPDYKTGTDRFLTAWRSPADPAPGNLVLKLSGRELPELLLWEGQRLKYRSGPWNGLRFSGIPEMKSYDMFNFTIKTTQDEMYYEFGTTKPNIYARLALNTSGVVQRLALSNWLSWNAFWSAPKDLCDDYATCGPYGVCDVNSSPVCDCLPGFTPTYPNEWYMRDGNGGCVRKKKLECTARGDGFLLVQQVKLPDTANSTVNISMSLAECRSLCLQNCSCTAYASANVTGGRSGCIMWWGNLTDIRKFVSNGQDLYLRLPASEIDSITRNSPERRTVAIFFSIAVVSALLLFGLCGYYCFWRKRKVTKVITVEGGARRFCSDTSMSREDPDIPLFNFEAIASATKDFSRDNIIGEGGFGIVYKGNLEDGQEVAVKRLSLHCVHGVDGFKNEVVLIARLQHRNLVRLLGCCIRGDEWMLVFEYMPNKSLDAFLFDDGRRHLLDWRKRSNIIMGVARGLLYLHQDSRLRIIHRDLKAGNILLDADMNPKISDFGTARIIGGDQMEVTMRVVGTRGYMSPEYAMDGVFSTKSDVFSFGVLTLEIISGRKNGWIPQTRSKLNLLAYVGIKRCMAWNLWKEDRCLELLDDKLPCPCPFSEVSRCIQVGLLCVQGFPDDRPAMQQVVLMLGNENSTLPHPKEPGFFSLRDPMAVESSTQHRQSWSANNLTVTKLEGR